MGWFIIAVGQLRSRVAWPLNECRNVEQERQTANSLSTRKWKFQHKRRIVRNASRNNDFRSKESWCDCSFALSTNRSPDYCIFSPLSELQQCYCRHTREGRKRNRQPGGACIISPLRPNTDITSIYIKAGKFLQHISRRKDILKRTECVHRRHLFYYITSGCGWSTIKKKNEWKFFHPCRTLQEKCWEKWDGKWALLFSSHFLSSNFFE